MHRVRCSPDAWGDGYRSIQMFVGFTPCHGATLSALAASSSHKKLVRLSCLSCAAVRRIPAPPASQDTSGPLPNSESTTEVHGVGSEGKRRKRPKKKAVRKQPFFERPEHILFRGNEAVVKRNDPVPIDPAVQVLGQIRMEIDVEPTPINGLR